MSGAGAESTASLLGRIRDGDPVARERLVLRCLPALQRWAHGRLPAVARDCVDTDDLVQDTFARALARIDAFEPRRAGAFLSYLRQILLNAIRKQVQRAARRGPVVVSAGDLPDGEASPLEQILGKEALGAYETALAVLPADMREAIVLRLELGFSHRQIAEALGLPSSDAARMQVTRAILRLARALRGHE